MARIKIKSKVQKQVLIEFLKKHDPDMLEFISEMAKSFGPFEITYSGQNENQLRAALYESSGKIAREAIDRARKVGS